MTALHAIKVEVAFAGTPADIFNGAAITWTDVTDYVRLSDTVTFSRGRSAEDSQVTAGRLSLLFNNDNGVFTYGNSHILYSYLATLYGSYTALAAAFPTYDDMDDFTLRIRLPIRVTHVDSATVLWTGTIDSFDLSWTAGHRPVVAISASDMVARTARKTLQALPLQVALGMGSLAWAYPIDEVETTSASGLVLPVEATDRAGVQTAAGRLVKTRNGSGGTPALTQGGGYSPGFAGGSAESGVGVWTGCDASSGYTLASTFDAGVSGYGAYPSAGNYTNGTTVHCMVLPVAHTRARTAVGLMGLFNVQQLGLTAAGKATWTHTAAGITLTGTTTVSIADWTHLAAVESVSGGTVTARLYVNGVQEATTTYASAGCYTAGEYIVAVGGTTSGTDMWDGSLCNVVAHQKALTAAQVLEIAGGRTGYDTDLSVTRFYRIARAAGLSTATTTGGASIMCVQYTKGMTADAAFAQCSEAEIAPWWVTAAGRVAMAPRTSRWNPTAVTTFPAQAVEADTAFTANDAFLINKAVISRPDGATVTKTNDASVLRYDEYLTERTLMVNSDTQTSDIAAWLVQAQAEPASRSEAFAVDLVTKQASVNVDLLVDLEVGDPFTVTGLPDTAPSTDVTLFTEGVSDTLTTTAWLRTINASPVTTGAAWVLDSSVLSVLDTSTIPAL